MANREGVFVYVGTYSSEADARLHHEAVKVLRESGEVGPYDAAAVTDAVGAQIARERAADNVRVRGIHLGGLGGL